MSEWMYRYFPAVFGLALIGLAALDNQQIRVSDWLLLWILIVIWNKD